MSKKLQSYSRTTEGDNDGDGAPDWRYVEWKEYSKQGLLLEEGYSYDYNADGTINDSTVQRYTYSGGNLVQQDYLRDNDGNGTLEQIGKITYETDRKGNVTLTRGVFDNDVNGYPDYIYEEANTYTQKGLLETSLWRYDWDGNNTFDYEEFRQFGYTNNGQLAWESHDYSNDGTVDWYTTYDYGHTIA